MAAHGTDLCFCRKQREGGRMMAVIASEYERVQTSQIRHRHVIKSINMILSVLDVAPMGMSGLLCLWEKMFQVAKKSVRREKGEKTQLTF